MALSLSFLFAIWWKITNRIRVKSNTHGRKIVVDKLFFLLFDIWVSFEFMTVQKYRMKEYVALLWYDVTKQ